MKLHHVKPIDSLLEEENLVASDGFVQMILEARRHEPVEVDADDLIAELKQMIEDVERNQTAIVEGVNGK